MEDNFAKTPSPGLPPKHGHAFDPATPIHSPHHSLNSSVSSRTPLHTLSLHEYRKLQNTPTSQSGTPLGKTLRRKAAAPALNGLERVPSISRTPVVGSRPSYRPLHLSQSAHQLAFRQPLPPSPPHIVDQTGLADSSFRSQSAEPGHLSGTGWSERPFENTSQKVGHWKPIKRLPKPHSAWPQAPPAQSTFARAPSVAGLPPIQTTPTSSTENVPTSGSYATPSTFSLSRFPHPPYNIGHSLSPPNDENAPPQLNTSFTTTAPATPPATPAVIHYRGASFDLVNPHDSLLFHDIVTPSRDIDSSDYLPLRTSEELLVSPEMAPRRLYTDLLAAHNSITRRDDGTYLPNIDLPLRPPPVALNPVSSESSQENSHGTDAAALPLAAKRSGAETRFSLREITPIRQITRTFNKTLGKSPGTGTAAQELEELSSPNAGPTYGNFEGQYPRPLVQSYPTTPVSTDRPPVRLSQGEQSNHQYTSLQSSEETGYSEVRARSAPLASMVPDDVSSQVGRTYGPRTSVSAVDMAAKPYYEEVSSLYPSSSIYTGDGEESNRNYPPSLYSRRTSKAYDPVSFEDDEYGNPYTRKSIYSFSNSNRSSNRISRPSTQGYTSRSQILRNEKTDTIGNLIDGYKDPEDSETFGDQLNAQSYRPQAIRGTSGLSQFEFGLQDDRKKSNNPSEASLPAAMRSGRARNATIIQASDIPPHGFASLAPAFEYEELQNMRHRPQTSDLASVASSYGDTRHLLQLSQPVSTTSSQALPIPRQALDPSSSYSQSENQNDVQTPKDALDQAEQIFEKAGAGSIPAMWARRNSGNLPRHKKSIVAGEIEEEKGDWETVENNSQKGRPSVDDDDDDDDSVADYSSSEGSRRGFDTQQESSLPVFAPVRQESSLYNHPSPLRPHENPFNSSPPALNTRASANIPSERNISFANSSSPPYSSTVPLFQSRTRGYNDEPYFFMPDPAPWQRPNASPYQLSEKETQELLNSGPNEEILYEDEDNLRPSTHTPNSNNDLYDDPENTEGSMLHAAGSHNSVSSEPGFSHTMKSPVTSPLHSGYNSMVERETIAFERENTFEKLSAIGPKGNLTGTPQGTGMHEVGSSVANTSSPGATWSSTPRRTRRPAGLAGFHADQRQSESRMDNQPSRRAPPTSMRYLDHGRASSQDTISSDRSRRPRSMRSARSSISGGRHRAHTRPAVAGQTRLREMVLATDAHSDSTAYTRLSQFMRGDESGRPSTSNTAAPLQSPQSRGIRADNVLVLASERSPHLLTPQRDLVEEEKAEQKKLSWLLFVCFLIPIPPLLMLYHCFGDSVIYWITSGRIKKLHGAPKRWSVCVSVIATLFLIGVIVVPLAVMFTRNK